MATQAQINSFVSEYADYAQQAAAATGLNAQLILAQWGNETAYGTDFAEKNNIGNVGVYQGGPNTSYGTIQEGVQAYINEINSPAMASVKATAGQSLQAQATALGNSGYAGGGYNNGSGPGSDLLADANTIAGAGYGSTVAITPTGGLASLSPSQGASLQAAVAEGGGAYLTAAQAQGNAPAQPGDQSSNGNAYSTIVSELDSYGLGSLAGWAWGELTGGKNSDQIMLDLQTQPAYEQSIFGQANAARTKNGLAPMTPADILAYQDQAYQYATAAGLPQGTISTGTIVGLLGNDVSASELNERLTSGYEAAMNAPQETRTLLSQYYGVNTGQLAAYYLNPNTAVGTLKSQLVAAEVGTQAAQSGFGQLSASAATQLSSELSAQGKVNPSGSGQWDVDVGSTFATLAPLAPLENAMPGMGAGAPPVSQNQLLSYGFLSKGQQQVNAAVETRKAFASGGGGEDVAATGVVGTGNASDAGNKQQNE